MRNKQYSYSQDYINRWVVSYADFVTMLLALFMVMYALTQMDINNLKEFTNSVDKVFTQGNVPETKHLDKIDLLKKKRELLRIFSTTKTSVKSENINISDQKKQIDNLENQVKNINLEINKEAVEFSNVKKLIEKNIGQVNGLSMTRESRGLIITLNDTILFDPGSAIIKDKARAPLDKLAVILREIPNSVRIEGHTDNQPIKTQKYPSNWELSTARATNIVRYLANNHKFSPNRLSAVGYGEYMPIKSNTTEEGRNTNRRVDIVILSTTSKIFEPLNKNVN